jgi:hypothetical protein
MLLLVLILIAMIALHVFTHINYRRWWRDVYMVEPLFAEMDLPSPPDSSGLAPWLIGSLGIAVLSFLTGLFGPPGGMGGPNRCGVVLLLVSLSLSFLWLVVVLVAGIVLRRRAFWLLVGAPGALCWPTILVLVLIAISECHPGCLPAD